MRNWDTMKHKLTPKYYRLLSQVRAKLKVVEEEKGNFDTRNILLIGRTGSGKSALANVLTNSNDFIESAGGVSQTHKTQCEPFTIGGVKYRVIDTIGFEETYGASESVIIGHIIAASCRACRQGGLNQIMFVNQGKFTPGEVKMYKLLISVIFDSGLVEYITIVRTNFLDFTDLDTCEKDVGRMIDSGGELGNIIENSHGRIIYVDNDHRNKEAIEESRRRLLKRLGECCTPFQLSSSSEFCREMSKVIA